MRTIKSGLFGFAAAGSLATLVVIGCSASGDSLEPATLVEPTQPEEDGSSSFLPPSNSAPDDGSDQGGETPVKDAGKKDASSSDASAKDAAKDTGPVTPATGEPCPTIDVKFSRACGKCGVQEALCRDNGAGAGVVSDYSLCKNELGDCEAGSTQACGNCGTQTCSNTCKWTTCAGQPPMSCSPGTTQFDTVSCTAPNTYVQRTCKDTCTWSSYSATCSAPPSFVTVPSTVGATNSTITVLDSSVTALRMPTALTCPVTAKFGTTSTPYAYVEVRNTNAKAVTVTISNTAAAGGTVTDTLMTAYAGTAIPTTEADRKNCVGGVNDNSTKFGFLSGLTIPANSSVQVYSAAFYAYSASNPKQTTGLIGLSVLTESVAP